MDKIDLNLIERCANQLLSGNKKNTEEQEKLPVHTMEEYGQIEDSFLRYRKMVEDALEIYDKAREIAVVTGTGLSGSINRIAEPFKKGCFTMAVVGKMSAGKSTFINALLGDNTLLPTGHFQTTCSLTTIEHSDKTELCVLYEDGHEEIISDNISGVLNKLVAIPEEYCNLPINYINRQIIEGVSPDVICSNDSLQYMSDKITKTEIDKDKLKDYLNTHEFKDIPMEVSIRCPLNENYRGWTLLDTPGVDAVGGMEDETKQLLCGKDENGCQNVDAIIFVQSAADNIEGKNLNEFVNNTVQKLTEEAKQRVFFVLTKSTMLSPSVKEKTVKKATDFFVNNSKIGIKSDRLVLVDSLSLLLAEEMIDFEKIYDGNDDKPDHWTNEEWEDCLKIISSVFFELSRHKKEINNENVKRELLKMSNFSELLSLLNEFVKSEKADTFKKLIELIETDISHCIQIKNRDLEILTNNLGSTTEQFLDNLNKEKEALKQFQIDANKKITEIRNTFSKEYVNNRFHEKALNEVTEEYIKTIPSIRHIKEFVEDKIHKSEEIRDNIISDIKNRASQIIDSAQVEMNISMPQIDIDDIEKKARISNTTSTYKTVRLYKKTGMFNSFKRFVGSVMNWMKIDVDFGYETKGVNKPVTNEDKVIADMRTKIYKELTFELQQYQNNIQKCLTSLIDNIDSQIKEKIQQRENDYNKMSEGETIVCQIEKREQEIAVLQKGIENLYIYKTV